MIHLRTHRESVAEKSEMKLLLIPTGCNLLGLKSLGYGMASVKGEGCQGTETLARCTDHEYLGLMQTEAHLAECHDSQYCCA
jgi:hypothetical protein